MILSITCFPVLSACLIYVVVFSGLEGMTYHDLFLEFGLHWKYTSNFYLKHPHLTVTLWTEMLIAFQLKKE